MGKSEDEGEVGGRSLGRGREDATVSLCARGGRGVTMMLSDACARALLEREEDLGKGARGTDEWGAEG